MSKPNFAPGSKVRLAAIDVGTNSMHMLVADVFPDGRIVPVCTMKEQTRLGEAIKENDLLESQAAIKVSEVLQSMIKEATKQNVSLIRAVGTHALRVAKNSNDFCDRVYKKCGLQIEVISGEEEARLIYLGVQQGLSIKNESVLLCDIGGGSTELLVGQWNEERFSISLKLGAVRLTQKIVKSDPISDSDMKSLKNYILTSLSPAVHEIRRVGFDKAIGSSGTIKSVKALALGLKGEKLPSTLHGAILTAKEIEMVISELERNRSLKSRKNLPKLDNKRADIIVAGAFVLSRVTKELEIKQWTISLSALREGTIVDMLERQNLWLSGDPNDVRWRSVRDFGKQLHVDDAHAFHITSLVVGLFDQLPPRLKIPRSWREYLRAASYLHECGRFLDLTAHHKHAHYLILNSNLAGFAIHELKLIATMVRFHRRRVPKLNDEVFSDFDAGERRALKVCIAVLRLAISLERGRQAKIKDIKLTEQADCLRIEVGARGSSDLEIELYHAEQDKKFFEEALGYKLTLAD